MTNSKWLSALLAGTALSVASTAAMADTSFLTMTRNAAGEGVTFAVSPTADMPAAATEVTVSGEIRTIVSTERGGGNRSSDVGTRARLFVKGKTETAVGTVGANIRVGESGIDDYLGYWSPSSDLKLFGGKTDSVSAVQHGVDWNGTGGVWDGYANGPTAPSARQAGVTFSSGPVAATIALEQNTGTFQTGGTTYAASGYTYQYGGKSPAIAGSLSFASGPMSAQVVAKYVNKSDTQAVSYAGFDGSSFSDTINGGNKAMVGVGATYAADMFTVSAAYVTGKGLQNEYTYFGTGYSPANTMFSAGSMLVTYNVSDAVRLEGFGSYATLNLEDDPDTTGAEDSGNANRMVALGGGAFYNPVKQLTIGAGASRMKTSYDKDSGSEVARGMSTTVGVGAWFKF